MTRETKRTTRREFLKAGGMIAGAAIAAGLSAGCMRDGPKQEGPIPGDSTSSEGRAEHKIFSSAQIGTMSVKNRLVRSATMIAAASGGRPTQEYIERYTELARGGVAVIITGFMVPTRADASYERQISVYADDHIGGLQQVAEAIHDADSECRIVAQIGHSGETVSPSGIKWPFTWKKKGRALASDEVDAIVNDFVDGIWRTKAAGFDGVELHGAHAYLLSSFLSPLTNKRTDQYGGSLENRVHIIRAIMDKARKRVGSDFPILIKVNSDDDAAGGIRPADFPALANEIVKTGIVAFDVSGNDSIQTGIKDIEDEAYFFPGAVALDVKTPIILTGGNRSVDHMEELLRSNKIDYLGMARPLIREPDLPNRWLRGTGANRAACISCNGCFNIMMQGKTAYCIQDA